VRHKLQQLQQQLHEQRLQQLQQQQRQQQQQPQPQQQQWEVDARLKQLLPDPPSSREEEPGGGGARRPLRCGGGGPAGSRSLGEAEEEASRLARENEALRGALGQAVKRLSQLEGEQERFLAETVFDLVNSLCCSSGAGVAFPSGDEGPSSRSRDDAAAAAVEEVFLLDRVDLGDQPGLAEARDQDSSYQKMPCDGSVRSRSESPPWSPACSRLSSPMKPSPMKLVSRAGA